jgi:hypothetical protein
MKKTLFILVSSILLSILILFIMAKIDSDSMKYILAFFRDKRGTLTYEGETQVRENFNIFFKLIIPIIFAISVGIVSALLFLINKNKS